MSTLHHASILENLAETIFDEIVLVNFSELSPSEEDLVYEIACTKAQQSFEDLCQ
tara:strand:+ start:858 stop:1022 length:165 start_codon:yes stop_codon:yes gene_type:complete